jgi:hypothetical protein
MGATEQNACVASSAAGLMKDGQVGLWVKALLTCQQLHLQTIQQCIFHNSST